MSHLLDGFLFEEEAAAQLNCSVRTVQRMMERREIAFGYVGRRRVIDIERTRALIRARKVKAKARPS